MMDFVLKMMKFVLKMMDFVLKMMNSVLKLVDFAWKPGDGSGSVRKAVFCGGWVVSTMRVWLIGQETVQNRPKYGPILTD